MADTLDIKLRQAASVLIAAQSGRALAEAARRAGLVPLVADFFGDADTHELAHAVERIESGLRGGFTARALVPALARLSAVAPSPPIGLILGSGFEDRPRLMETLSRSWRLLGNSAGTVAAVKNPYRLADAARVLGLPFPAVAAAAGLEGAWLVKRIGASGGVHVHPAKRAGPVGDRRYAMQWRAGEAWSLGFVGTGSGALPIGFCRQWSNPTKASPYRFGGIGGALDLQPGLMQAIERAADDLSRHFRLVGLCSLDLLIDGDDWCISEINPRSGASLDVLDRDDAPLVSAHIASIEGGIACLAMVPRMIRVADIIYARRTIGPVRQYDWPVWIKDRPCVGAMIPAGSPLATVVAEGTTLAEAKEIAHRRAADLDLVLGG